MADILEGEQVAKLLHNLVYEKKQVHVRSVDLTVKSVSRIREEIPIPLRVTSTI